jgi:hypothetical protein
MCPLLITTAIFQAILWPTGDGGQQAGIARLNLITPAEAPLASAPGWHPAIMPSCTAAGTAPGGTAGRQIAPGAGADDTSLLAERCTAETLKRNGVDNAHLTHSLIVRRPAGRSTGGYDAAVLSCSRDASSRRWLLECRQRLRRVDVSWQAPTRWHPVAVRTPR